MVPVGLNVTRYLSNLFKVLSYLLDKCYFKLVNKIFRQVIGIPMGLDPAPFTANVFLYYYEIFSFIIISLFIMKIIGYAR